MFEKAVVAIALLVIALGIGSCLVRRRLLDVVVGINVFFVGLILLSVFFHNEQMTVGDSVSLLETLMLLGLAWFILGMAVVFRQYLNSANVEISKADKMRH